MFQNFLKISENFSILKLANILKLFYEKIENV